MRYSLASLLVMLALAAPASASLEIVTPFVSGPAAPVGFNNFATELSTRIIPSSTVTPWAVVSDVEVTLAGTLRFYGHASESGFTNTFHVEDMSGNPYSYTENGLLTGWFDPATPFAEFAVDAGTMLSDLVARFTTTGLPASSTPGVNAGIGEVGFAIFVSSVGSAYDPLRLFFGYDDNGAGPDDNHDDLIISVTFERSGTVGGGPGTVPEPISGVVWGLLAAAVVALPGVARRR